MLSAPFWTPAETKILIFSAVRWHRPGGLVAGVGCPEGLYLGIIYLGDIFIE